jgi:hypothetical protein
VEGIVLSAADMFNATSLFSFTISQNHQSVPTVLFPIFVITSCLGLFSIAIGQTCLVTLAGISNTFPSGDYDGMAYP